MSGLEHSHLQLRLEMELLNPVPDEALDGLADVIAKSLGEFLARTGHQSRYIEVHIHGVPPNDSGEILQ